MIKLNKHGLISKRLIAPEFTVGNTFVEGGGTSEELAVLSLTNEQLAALSYIVNGEGRIIPVGEDGTFDTKIGHSYCIRHTDDLTLHEAWLSNDENLYVKRYGSGQLLFFATSEKCKINDPSYIVTEVFRMAALNDFVDWSGISTTQAWFKEIEVELTELLGSNDNFILEIVSENTLVVHTDRLVDTQFEAVTALLEQVVPQNIEVERKNYILPVGYKAVEYLEYAGNKTGFRFENVMGLGFIQESEFMLTANHAGRILFMNGTFNEWWSFGQTGQNKVSAALGNGIYCSNNTKYKIVYTFDENKVQTIECDGQTSIYSEDSGNYPTGNEKRWAAFPEISTNQFFARLYSLKMACARHGINMKLVPCLDDVGAPCLFDVVNYETYYNHGSDDFLYPTDSTTYALRRVLPDWGQLTPHGLRRLYHTPEGYKGELYDYALENGYKPIIESEMPEEGYWTPKWRETEGEIVLEWVETGPPMDLED